MCHSQFLLLVWPYHVLHSCSRDAPGFSQLDFTNKSGIGSSTQLKEEQSAQCYQDANPLVDGGELSGTKRRMALLWATIPRGGLVAGLSQPPATD